ncbi:hypothetical protein DTL42_10565 [Bremerella cremea]|uniref:Uncharacterized protein n=1 Tax=Bremerella cremea TaxID=1031537 RepID=A0A368KRV8_9BACT|nr:hypothetical protein DTL42_10565 [Bremerella cremea]
MSGNARKRFAQQWLDRALAEAQPRGRYRNFYWNLIHVVRSRSSIFAAASSDAPTNYSRLYPAIQLLSEMAELRSCWIQMPEQWENGERGFHRQLRSLMRHLFEAYPVPDFVAYSWLPPRQAEWVRQLYLHLAKGWGMRQFETQPLLKLSPKGAKFLMEVPPHLGIIEGIRWAQIRGLGGTLELANYIVANTFLRHEMQDEHFWESVLRFFFETLPCRWKKSWRLFTF